MLGKALGRNFTTTWKLQSFILGWNRIHLSPEISTINILTSQQTICFTHSTSQLDADDARMPSANDSILETTTLLPVHDDHDHDQEETTTIMVEDAEPVDEDDPALETVSTLSPPHVSAPSTGTCHCPTCPQTPIIPAQATQYIMVNNSAETSTNCFIIYSSSDTPSHDSLSSSMTSSKFSLVAAGPLHANVDKVTWKIIWFRRDVMTGN